MTISLRNWKIRLQPTCEDCHAPLQTLWGHYTGQHRATWYAINIRECTVDIIIVSQSTVPMTGWHRHFLSVWNCEIAMYLCLWLNKAARSSFPSITTRGPFYWHGSTLLPAWISNYIHYNVWMKSLIHSQTSTTWVWKRKSNSILYICAYMITYPCGI